jgi:hypothetical protein
VLAGITEKRSSTVTDNSIASMTHALAEQKEALTPDTFQLECGPGMLLANAEFHGPLAHFCAGTVDGCKKLLQEVMNAITRLDDCADLRAAAQGFREPWRGFLAALNLFQHLPHFVFVSTELIETYGPVRVTGPLAELQKPDHERVEVPEAMPERQGDISSDAKALLNLLFDTEIQKFARTLIIRGAPIPEVGFELADESGRIIGEAELAWPDRLVAIVSAAQFLGTSCFESAGWKLVRAGNLMEEVDRVLILLGSAKEETNADRRHLR